MTNPRDPEGLMPDAGPDGPDVTAEGHLPFDGAAMEGGQDRAAFVGRTDVDRFGSDPDTRFPGESEDPTMTTGDAGSASGAGVSQPD